MTNKSSSNPSLAKQTRFSAISSTSLIPLFGLSCLILIYLFDLNQTLFLSINSISQTSGETLWAAITLFGDPIILVCLVLSFHTITPRLSFAILPALIIGGSAVMYFKGFFSVLRPSGALQDIVIIGIPPTSGAFPSGHTAGAFALATLLILLTPNRYLKLLLFALALLIGVSRIAVGVHWPLDISAGIVFGWLSAIMGLYISKDWSDSPKKAVAINVLLLIFSLYLLFRNTGYNQVQLIQFAIAFGGIGIAAMSLMKNTGRK